MAAEPVRHRAAVLGSPIAHSLSPRLHNAGYAALGLSDWQYTAAEVTEDGLSEFVAGLDGTWRGLSLTMPLKEVAFEVATTVSDLAVRAGAINTLVRRGDGGWDADNTDVAGIVESLRPLALDDHAVVIGAGATARSAVLALEILGVPRVTVAARRPEPAHALAAFADTQGLRTAAVPLADWCRQGAGLVLSTVPAGGSTDLVAATAGSSLDLVLFDVVYAGWPSPLAAAVTAAGGTAVSGLEMLLHQAVAQFALFTGRQVGVETLRAAVESPC